MTAVSVACLKRLLDINKDAAKARNQEGDGGMLIHLIASSTAWNPHTAASVDATGLILDAHRRGREAEDLAGLRPLHLLCSSKAPTEFTVKICEKLLEGQGAVVASLNCVNRAGPVQSAH
ncbi:hypothetical protein T484DRAFT_1790853 [Baffinella frigidus]|nr:hypothetical protein T484DRAFT_1790853 [Cryptophyta sp. CCMP2293]